MNAIIRIFRCSNPRLMAVGLLLTVMFLSGCVSPPIHVAARKGNLSEVKRLLDAGASTEEKCETSFLGHQSPLMVASAIRISRCLNPQLMTAGLLLAAMFLSGCATPALYTASARGVFSEVQ